MNISDSTVYLKNVKKLLEKPQTSFILMGITAFFICNYSSSMVAIPSVIEQVVPSVLEAAERINPSLLITSKNQHRFKQIANFELPPAIKSNNVSKHISKVQLDKKEYFLALASQAEGFRANIYKDNEGWAIGNGWNLTKQSPEYNKELAKAVFSDKKTIDTLTSMSGKSDKPVTMAQMKAVKIKPQEALQITYLIGEKIKTKYVIPGISQVIQKNQNIEKSVADKIASKVFYNLKKNEQDTLIYHAYKCGGYSFLTFSNLVTKIIDYSLKRKSVSKESIVAEFNYSFKLDGKKVIDKQAQEIVSAMFIGPQNFAQVTNIKVANFEAKINSKDIKTASSSKNDIKLSSIKNKFAIEETSKKIKDIRTAKLISKNKINLAVVNNKKNNI